MVKPVPFKPTITGSEEVSCDRQWVAEDKSWTDFYPERKHALYTVTLPT
jgi:hypothetical protein